MVLDPNELILHTQVIHVEGSKTLAFCFFAVHSVLALEFERRSFLTPSDRMVRQVLKRFGSRAAIWERVLLKPVFINMRVSARVFLNSVHSLVVLFQCRSYCWHCHDRLQWLVPACRLRCREGLDYSHRRRVQAAEHLHVLQDTSSQVRQGAATTFLLKISFLHCFQGEQAKGTFVGARALQLEQF